MTIGTPVSWDALDLIEGHVVRDILGLGFDGCGICGWLESAGEPTTPDFVSGALA